MKFYDVTLESTACRVCFALYIYIYIYMRVVCHAGGRGAGVMPRLAAAVPAADPETIQGWLLAPGTTLRLR